MCEIRVTIILGLVVIKRVIVYEGFIVVLINIDDKIHMLVNFETNLRWL